MDMFQLVNLPRTSTFHDRKSSRTLSVENRQLSKHCRIFSRYEDKTNFLQCFRSQDVAQVCIDGNITENRLKKFVRHASAGIPRFVDYAIQYVLSTRDPTIDGFRIWMEIGDARYQNLYAFTALNEQYLVSLL